jgi:hypothetical protein
MYPVPRLAAALVVTGALAAPSASYGSTLSATTETALLPPVNLIAPQLSGTAQAGATLSVDAGIWDTVLTGVAYQWQHCDAAGADCNDIAAATATNYQLGAPEVGATLRVRVTATNAAGSTDTVSAASAAVVAASTDNASATPDPGPDPGVGDATTNSSPGNTAGTTTDRTAGTTTGKTGMGLGTASGSAGNGGVSTGVSTGAGSTAGGAPTCLRLVGRRPRTAHVLRSPMGVLAVRPATQSRLLVTFRGKRIRSVTYRMDGRRLVHNRRASSRLTLGPQRLAPGRHVLSARVSPRRGAPRTLTIQLQVAPC